MNLKNKKKLLILIFFAMLILIVLLILDGNSKTKNNSSNGTNLETKNYVYNFNQTLNLEVEKGIEENESIGTEISNVGIITDYYDEDDVEFIDGKIYLQSFEGVKVVSFSWPEEGIVSLIKEPDFGVLDRVISNKEYSEITAIYKDVTLKNIDSYINLLADLGFINVEMKEKSKNKDYYSYIATNQDGAIVILSYSEGSMNLKLR